MEQGIAPLIEQGVGERSVSFGPRSMVFDLEGWMEMNSIRMGIRDEGEMKER